MKLAWLTDIHLNFLDTEQRKKFYNTISAQSFDAVLLSGDIAEAPTIEALLLEMVESIQRPLYFVLGNHDYYKGQIDDVKTAMRRVTRENTLLHYLPTTGVHTLTETVCLVGQDGWADGRLGDYQNSRVNLMDSRMITDLFQQKIVSRDHLLKKMQALADTDAKQLSSDLQKAVSSQPKKIIVITHVPPFKECSLYEGKISNDDFLPYFSSKATGDVLVQVAGNNPAIEFLVLAGHTHHNADYQALDNLQVKVGKAEYYQPEVQEIIEIQSN